MLQGRETPSPVDTPYLCRQRNNIGAAQVSRDQTSEIIERGALLACSNHLHENSHQSIATKESCV